MGSFNLSESNGTSQSTATQGVSTSFIPTVIEQASPPLVSPYPAGQGLATINVAYPGSAAYGGTSSTSTSATALSSMSAVDWLLIAGAAVAAWMVLKK